jgi:hypothetical protein
MGSASAQLLPPIETRPARLWFRLRLHRLIDKNCFNECVCKSLPLLLISEVRLGRHEPNPRASSSVSAKIPHSCPGVGCPPSHFGIGGRIAPELAGIRIAAAAFPKLVAQLCELVAYMTLVVLGHSTAPFAAPP